MQGVIGRYCNHDNDDSTYKNSAKVTQPGMTTQYLIYEYVCMYCWFRWFA
jgi:hypothetical protein